MQSEGKEAKRAIKIALILLYCTEINISVFSSQIMHSNSQSNNDNMTKLTVPPLS